MDHGGDLGQFSIDHHKDAFDSQDSIASAGASGQINDSVASMSTASTSTSTSPENKQQRPTTRRRSKDEERGSEKEKEKARRKEKEKEIPSRQGGTSSLPTAMDFTAIHSSSSSNHLRLSHPKSFSTDDTIKSARVQPVTSSTNNSVESNNSDRANRTGSASASTSTTTSGFSSVREKLGQGWYRTVGSIHANNSSSSGNHPKQTSNIESSSDSERNGKRGQDGNNLKDDTQRRAQGQGDLSIPFSSMDESIARQGDADRHRESNSTEINRRSIRSNRTEHDITDGTSRKDREKERGKQTQVSRLGNKFGLGARVSTPPSIDTSSPISTSTSTSSSPTVNGMDRSNLNFGTSAQSQASSTSSSRRERELPESSLTTSVPDPVSPKTPTITTINSTSAIKKSKKKRASRSTLSSPTAGGHVSEPNSPVPPRRTSLNISRNDYLKMEPGSAIAIGSATATGNGIVAGDEMSQQKQTSLQDQESESEKQPKGLGLSSPAGVHSSADRTQPSRSAMKNSRITSSSNSRSRSRSRSTSKRGLDSTLPSSSPSSQTSSLRQNIATNQSSVPNPISPSNPLTPTTPTAPTSSTSGNSSSMPFSLPLLQRYVLSIGIVNFDLDLGPDLEFLYPPLGISREERDNIAFSSFPDTSIFDDGSCVFSWRVREVPLRDSKEAPPIIGKVKDKVKEKEKEKGKGKGNEAQEKIDTSQSGERERVSQRISEKFSPDDDDNHDDHPIDKAGAVVSPGQRAAGNATGRLSTNYIYGYVFFRQKRDPRIRRGYFQKSLVILSHLPYVSLFERLVRILGTMFFEESSGSGRCDLSNRTDGNDNDNEDEEENRSIDGALQETRSSQTESGNQDTNVLLEFCRNVTGWPEPIPGEMVTLELPFLDRHRHRPVSRDRNRHRDSNFNSDFNTNSDTNVNANNNTNINPSPSETPSTVSSLIVSLPNSFSSSQTSFLNDGHLLPPSTSAAGRPNSLLIAKSKSTIGSKGSGSGSGSGSLGPATGKDLKFKNETGQTRENPLLANIPSRNLFDTFREVLPDLWLLWECLLLADPILIMAPDPSRCSEAIWHAIDLIRPIPFAGDFRPFFTMQDHDVSILVNKNKPQSGTLLGVTNPFFKQACDHWSSTLRVGKGGLSSEEKERIEMEERERERERNSNNNQSRGFHFHHSTSTTSHQSNKDHGSTSAGYSNISQADSISNSNSIPIGRVAGGNSAGGGGPDHTPGFTTKRKRRVSKDRPLLRRLLEMAEKRDNDLAANALLRRYFSSLTEMFLAPLNRYVSTLIPADFDLSSPIEAPRLKPFSTNDFLSSLKSHGTPISLKSKNLPTGNNIRQSLYTDFLNCPNFSLWLTERLNQAEEEQRKRRISVLENDDVIKFAKNRGEIESLDLYERLVEEIKRIDERLNQPISLGPSSRWRTDNPDASANFNTTPSQASNPSDTSANPASSTGFKPLEKVTSTDSSGTINSESFVDARSSISSSVCLSDASDPRTPTIRRSQEAASKTASNPRVLKNGTTSSGLISESGRGTPTRGFSNSYSASSTSSLNQEGQVDVKQLNDRKVKLLKQLEKLAETFPDDLRGSLRVKP